MTTVPKGCRALQGCNCNHICEANPTLIAYGAIGRRSNQPVNQIRHVRFDYPAKGMIYIGLPPTPPDLLEQAESALTNKEEYECSTNDTRLKSFKKVRKLLS